MLTIKTVNECYEYPSLRPSKNLKIKEWLIDEAVHSVNLKTIYKQFEKV